jgi:hypothetical protein
MTPRRVLASRCPPLKSGRDVPNVTEMSLRKSAGQEHCGSNWDIATDLPGVNVVLRGRAGAATAPVFGCALSLADAAR